ncbi:hypothetical protein IX51_02890 [uncultured archaeon]|nr:hypothetical protein IX51_02890 [uncultured archaeon]
MRVESYQILLKIDEEANKFSGSEEITLNADPGKLVLDSVDLNVEKVEVDGKPAKFSAGKASLAVENIPSGDHVVHVEFEGTIGQNLTGLYLAKTDEGDMFTTQFESTGARRVFPCIDNPGYKAEFELSLDIAKGLGAISNMPPLEITEQGGRKTVRFMRTPRMSTYLLYIGVGEFEEKRLDYNGKDVILAAPKGHLSPSDFPLEVAEKCLKLFEDYFGIHYMLPKMHLISVPEFAAGAMENWGALTFREVLLYADNSTGSLTKKRIASVIAHEIAHQWFGDLVTMKWWNDLWLNESFATFMAYKMVNEIYPEMDAFGEMIMTRTSGALMDDALLNSHPIDVEVEDPNSVAQIFDQISYGKGASVLRMIEAFVGEDNFRDGIREYLEENKYSNTRGADLWSSISKVSGMPVSEIMEAWITKQGYPVVHASRENGEIRLEQHRFLLGSSGDSIWPVPLTVRRESSVESTVLDKKTGSIPAAGFIKANHENTGFYRVQYSDDLMRNLIGNSGKLSYLDKWGLVNDYYAFLLSGRIGLDDYISILGSFENEEHHIVVEEIASQLLRLHMKAPDNRTVKDTALKLLGGFLKGIGEKSPGEDMNTSILRGSLSQKLAILDGNFASKLAGKFSALDTVDPDMRSAVVLSYAISENNFDGLINRLGSSRKDEEKTRIISALGWLRDSDSLEKANMMVLDGRIKRQDSMSFFASVAAAPHSRDFSFEHLEESIEFLKRTFSGSRRASAALEGIVPLVGMGRKSEMEELLEKIRAPETEKGILKGKELLEINESFREKYGGA